MFSNALAKFVPAVCHDDAHAEEVVAWAETAGGQVALLEAVSSIEESLGGTPAREELPCIALARSPPWEVGLEPLAPIGSLLGSAECDKGRNWSRNGGGQMSKHNFLGAKT